MEQKSSELLRKYSPLARRIAGGYRRRLPHTVTTSDIFAAAMYGLWDAIRLHPEDQPGFAKCAALRIRGAIVDELRAGDWTSRRHRAHVEAGKAGRVSIVYDEDMGESEETPSRSPDPEAALSWKEECAGLDESLLSLTDKERECMIAHYFQDLNFREVGRSIGVSFPRVLQLHSAAIDRLRGVTPAASIRYRGRGRTSPPCGRPRHESKAHT